MVKLVVLTGAGISAESGLGTFRDKGGLWDEYPVEEVATYDAWLRNPKLVLDFYNMRRAAVIKALPNPAHFALAELEKYFDTTIVTQNIDDLHERAGSTNVIHLHGEIKYAKGSGGAIHGKESLYLLDKPTIELGDLAPDGTQARPHVVWFGEAVPNMVVAENVMAQADVLMVVGTSLNVYPAANLIYHAPEHAKRILVDKHDVQLPKNNSFEIRRGNASEVLPILKEELKQNYSLL